MPLEFLDACLEVLLNIVCTLVLIVVEHDAFESVLGECQFAHLVLAVLAQVLHEAEVAVGSELCLQVLCDALAERLLVGDVALTVNLVEEFLVHLCLGITRNLGNLVTEVGSDVLCLFARHLQQTLQFARVLRVSLLGVKGDDVAQFCALEESLLLVLLDVFGHHDCSFNSDAAFLGVSVGIEFAKVALQHVVSLILLHLVVVARA